MKAAPTDEELAAIVAALRSLAPTGLTPPPQPTSRWRAAARREALGSALPKTWNG